MSLCLIGLGSNEGDRQETLVRALDQLGRHSSIRVLRRSRFSETTPVGGPSGQQRFLNAAALLDTSLDASDLLRVLLKVEADLGRRRAETWGPRTVDLDLLLYEDLVHSTPTLTLPHPRMAWRRFVLEPAAEVAPNTIHPTTGWTIARLLEHLNTTKNYVAITGPVAAGKADLARQVAKALDAHWISDVADPHTPVAFCADPTRNAGATELELLHRRVQSLATESSVWQASANLWVSDFWLDQCLAFAGVWLPVDRWTAVAARLIEAAREVVRPKLIVLVDRPTDELLARIGALSDATARRWTREPLDRLREALAQCVREPDVGPVMRLTDQPPELMLREILAAAEAMK